MTYPENYYGHPQYPPTNFAHPYYYQGGLQPSYPSWPVVSEPSRVSTAILSNPQSTKGNPSTSTAPIASSSTVSADPTSNLTATPALVSQIDLAASKDPELRRLLSVAAEEKATLAELEKLHRLIKDMATPAKNSAARSTSSTSVPSVSKPTYPPAKQRNTDVLVEFSEHPGDFYILPLSNSIVEHVIQGEDNIDIGSNKEGMLHDVKISTLLPGSAVDVRQRLGYAATGLECQPVTIKLTGATNSLWNAISMKVMERQARVAKVVQDMVSLTEGPQIET